MRDYNRRRVAEAKSHNASKEDLAAAKQRIKEIEEELRQVELQPETKQGEERELRYNRVLRLRSMRAEFQTQFPVEQPPRAYNLLLALVMTVASFMLCAFCAGGGYLAVNLLSQKPDPVNTANAFLTAAESESYPTAWTLYFSPTLREQLDISSFETQAKQADTKYGAITSYTLISQSGDSPTSVLNYSIKRGQLTYNVTLQMLLFHNSWGISNLGNTLTPNGSGASTPPAGTPSPHTGAKATVTPTAGP